MFTPLTNETRRKILRSKFFKNQIKTLSALHRSTVEELIDTKLIVFNSGTMNTDRSPKSFLQSSEARALCTAVGFMTAGEADGVPQREVDAALSGSSKIASAPAQSVWIPFSKKEIEMIYIALENGAESVLQSSSGLRADQQKAFRAAANRIADAGGFVIKF